MDRKTCRKIYKEFERNYPRLSKDVVHFCPYEGFATIAVYLSDGRKLSYSSEYERAVFLNDRWKAID